MTCTMHATWLSIFSRSFLADFGFSSLRNFSHIAFLLCYIKFSSQAQKRPCHSIHMCSNSCYNSKLTMWQLCWGLDHIMAIPGKCAQHHVLKYMQQTCNAIDWIARNDLLTEASHNIAWKDWFGWRPPEDINMSSKQLLVFPRLAIYMESCHKLLSITCQSNQHKSA